MSSRRCHYVELSLIRIGIFQRNRHVNVEFPYSAGFEEDGFLKSLDISLEELEPVADNCTRVRRK